MPEIAQATISVTPVLDGAQKTITDELTGAAGPAGEKAGSAAGSNLTKTLGDSMTKAGGTLSKAVTAPLVGIGAASVAAWKEVDDGLDAIVQKTGASGEALEDMQDVLNNITTSIPTDFSTAGAAIGEVSTRFGITGKELEDLSGQFLKFAKLNDTDVSNSIDSVQKALSAFGLDASGASDMLDVLNKVGQDTGVSVDTLTNGLIQNGTAFQQMGLSADQAAIFMGQMETSGANSETVMQGLRKALKNSAADGLSMNEALAQLQDSILNGTDSMDGLTAAYDLFGKSGDQIYGAIQNGTLDFTALGEAAIDAGGSVNDTFEGTLDPMDSFQTTLNELKITGADLVTTAGPMLSEMLSGLSDGAKKLSEAWNGLSPEMQETIIKVAGIAAVVGPLLLIGGKVIGGISTIAGGLGGLVGHIGGLGSAASAASGPVGAAGTSFGAMAGQALQLLAAGAAFVMVAYGVSLLADAAIRVAEAGTPAIAVLAGMGIGIMALMGVTAALAPALTAGAVGIATFGASVLMIGAGVALATAGISILVNAVSNLVQTVSSNATEINSIVSNIGTTVSGVIDSISGGITSIIDSLTGGISGVLDSVAGIIDSIGNAALNAGTGFEKLADAVIKLVNNTGVLDLGATLGTVAGGVKDINKAAKDAGSGASQITKLSSEFTKLGASTKTTSTALSTFGRSGKTAFTQIGSSFKSMNLATSMKTAIAGATLAARLGIDNLKRLFSTTTFSFNHNIAVPHFAMSGKFDAKTNSVPTVKVSGWWAKAAQNGALFSEPTIIGVGDANESEILLGESKLRELAGGGNSGITVNLNYDASDDATDMLRDLARGIKRYRMAGAF